MTDVPVNNAAAGTAPQRQPAAGLDPSVHARPGHDHGDADHGGRAHGGQGHVAHQFDDSAQQHDAATLGMWTFLATEVLFFGGIFMGYSVYRWRYHYGFSAGSHELKELLGGLNTAVLLCSSLSMAMAVHRGHQNNARSVFRYAIATMILGAAFLGVKAVEYTIDYREGLFPGLRFGPTYWEGESGERIVANIEAHAKEAQAKDLDVTPGAVTATMKLFFIFYFILTGLHGLHMVIGIVLVGIGAWHAMRGRIAGKQNYIEMTGLYWHFVDIVWIFLFPLLYLIR